ncbi:MAG: hypothetical protein Q8853_03020, partial [Candidatus Phytoplasma australasiaticum]|nr:hypothetical protein [Candidatus Phytoplasma australasiaticum]
MRACQIIEKGCITYLAHILVVTQESPSLENTRVAKKVMHVFPTDLHGVLPDYGNGFAINMEPGTKPILVALYRITLTELKELKEQLETVSKDKSKIVKANKGTRFLSYMMK